MNLAIAVRLLIAIIMFTNLAACATTPHSVAVPKPGDPPGSDEIFVGASVRVVKVGGEVMEFEVVEVTPTGLRGDLGVVPYAEMRSLAVLRPSAGNIGLVLAIVGAAIGIIVIGQAVNDLGAAAVFNSSN